MYGKSEISKLDFKSEITAKAAKVIPMAKDPVLPTNILPWRLKKASKSHTTSGTHNKITFDPETVIIPIIITTGQIVSKPFNPPS